MSRVPTPSAYLIGLRLLARRDLSIAQLRDRLARRALPPDDIDAAVTRLIGERALDDTRTALVYARRSAGLKLRGKDRTRRELEALGIDPSTARHAVETVFDEVDEDAVLERAVARRLAGPIRTRAQFRRLYQALIRQGFPPGKVAAELVARSGGETAFVEE